MLIAENDHHCSQCKHDALTTTVHSAVLLAWFTFLLHTVHDPIAQPVCSPLYKKP
jgi:hypothetical protein